MLLSKAQWPCLQRSMGHKTTTEPISFLPDTAHILCASPRPRELGVQMPPVTLDLSQNQSQLWETGPPAPVQVCTPNPFFPHPESSPHPLGTADLVVSHCGWIHLYLLGLQRKISAEWLSHRDVHWTTSKTDQCRGPIYCIMHANGLA